MPKRLFQPPRFLSALMLAGLGLAAAPAHAQLVLDGGMSVEIAHNAETGIKTKHVSGSFAGLVYKDFGLQFDISAGKHERFTSTQPAATLHLYHAPSEALAYGLFLSAEDRRPGNSYFYGGELAYGTETFGIEAFLAYRNDIAADTNGTRYGIDLHYRPGAGKWTIFGGGAVDEGDPLEQSYVYLGASYDIREGVSLGLTAGQNNEGDFIASALLTLQFGDGSPFTARDTMQLFPGHRSGMTVTPP